MAFMYIPYIVNIIISFILLFFTVAFLFLHKSKESTLSIRDKLNYNLCSADILLSLLNSIPYQLLISSNDELVLKIGNVLLLLLSGSIFIIYSFYFYFFYLALNENSQAVLYQFMFYWISGLIFPLIELLFNKVHKYVLLTIGILIYINMCRIPLMETVSLIRVCLVYKRYEAKTEEEEIKKKKNKNKIICFGITQIVVFVINWICIPFIYISIRNQYKFERLFISILYSDTIYTNILNIIFIFYFVYDEETYESLKAICCSSNQKKKNDNMLIDNTLFLH